MNGQACQGKSFQGLGLEREPAIPQVTGHWQWYLIFSRIFQESSHKTLQLLPASSLLPQNLDSVSRLVFLEILGEHRHGLASTVITSQLPVASWHEVIGDPTIADAICDHMINTSYRIELKGDSLRKKYGKGDEMKK